MPRPRKIGQTHLAEPPGISQALFSHALNARSAEAPGHYCGTASMSARASPAAPVVLAPQRQVPPPPQPLWQPHPPRIVQVAAVRAPADAVDLPRLPRPGVISSP